MDNKHNIDKFQGYPHYPANEDITRPNNNNGKVSIDGTEQPAPRTDSNLDERDPEASIIAGSDSDLTSEDLRILDAAEQNMDTEDGRNLMASTLDYTDADGDPLNESSLTTDLTGEDLDVPGSNADNADELIGEEDEENNYYSLGGDNHESQEENKGD